MRFGLPQRFSGLAAYIFTGDVASQFRRVNPETDLVLLRQRLIDAAGEISSEHRGRVDFGIGRWDWTRVRKRA